MKYILAGIVGFIVIAGGYFATHQVQSTKDYITTQPALFGSYNPTGGGTYRLGQSVGTTDTTIKLSSFKEPVSNIPYTMSYLNSDIEYATLSPQSSISEFISFSGITQNSDGSATLTGIVRGMSRTPGTGGCVASTTLAQGHAGQSILILSNPPCQLGEYIPLRTNATSSAYLTFSSTSPPRLDYSAAQSSGTYISTTSEFATINYVNAVALSGVANATAAVKGIIQLATALQAASSTSLGTTGASLGLTAAFATDTPQRGCAVGFTGTAGAGCSIVADLTGHIKQAWLDLTQAWSFTGAVSIIASPSAKLTLDGLSYVFPPSRQASSTVLSEDGSGNLTWEPNSGLQYLNTNPGGFAGAVGATTTVFTTTIPGGTLKALSTISCYLPVSNANLSAAGTLRVYASYGGLSTTTASLISVGGTGGSPFGYTKITLSATTTAAEKLTLENAMIDTTAADTLANVTSSYYTVDTTVAQSFQLSVAVWKSTTNNGYAAEQVVCQSIR